MKMTRNGIIYELEYSPYYIDIDGVEYYFSSLYHMDKFVQRYVENRKTLSKSLFNRFKFWLEINRAYDIILYNKIETRGFLIKIEGIECKCLKNLVLSGEEKIKRK